MKSRLISYTSNDLLYLPVVALKNSDASAIYGGTPAINSHLILVDEQTVNALTNNSNALDAGILNGYQPSKGINIIATDQGLDTSELSPDEVIDPTLLETQYFVQIDNRLGSIRPSFGGRDVRLGSADSEAFQPTSVDDDNIATYIFTVEDESGVVSEIAPSAASAIIGPRGTRVSFKIASSLDLKTNTFLFNQIGSTGTVAIASGTQTLAAANHKFIDSTVRVTGVSTGYSLDIPIRFIKDIS